jgi:GlpG protein
MRMIGQIITEANARTFGDYLQVQGIENVIEPDKDNSWAIWVNAEEEMERAKKFLAEYQAQPADAKYQNAGPAAREVRERKEKEQAAYAKRMKRSPELFQPMAVFAFGPLTIVLIAISIIVFAVCHLLPALHLEEKLQISSLDYVSGLTVWRAFLERLHGWREIMPNVLGGEVWRLITPIFLHFSFLHIFFNMLCLRDMGSMIESRQGSLMLLVLVLVFGLTSDMGQFLVAGPGFGGMSGVIYGLMGYIWIRGKLDPGSGLYLHPSTVILMLIWFFACFVFMMGVANTAHAVGLVVGMAWGALSSLRHLRR